MIAIARKSSRRRGGARHDHIEAALARGTVTSSSAAATAQPPNQRRPALPRHHKRPRRDVVLRLENVNKILVVVAKNQRYLWAQRAREARRHEEVRPHAAAAPVAPEDPVLPPPDVRVVHARSAQRVRQLVQQREVDVAARDLRAYVKKKRGLVRIKRSETCVSDRALSSISAGCPRRHDVRPWVRSRFLLSANPKPRPGACSRSSASAEIGRASCRERVCQYV